MSRIYWDTMLFAYLLEGHSEFGPRVRRVRERMKQRGDGLLTSVLTVGELLVNPIRNRNEQVEISIRTTLRPPIVELIGIDQTTMEFFARIRAGNRVSAPDAIHLACAAQSGADLFLTNDRTLAKLHVPGIQFIATLDTDLL